MKYKNLKKYICVLLTISFFLSSFTTISFFNTKVYGAEGLGFNLDISLSDALMEGRKNINLDWDSVVFENESNKTRYLVMRKDLSTGEWEVRGNYNKNIIKVLNIYPEVAGSAGLKNWMTALKSGVADIEVNIDVTPVKISAFNSSPTSYLYKNSEGIYNYDVVVFGFWDSNNGKDLTADSIPIIQDFINNDGGVIFGHDTLTVKGNSNNVYFSQLIQNNLSLETTPKSTSNRIVSDEIKVVKQTSATTYPFDINDEVLRIPFSHTVAQIPTNPNSIVLGFEKNVYTEDGSGPYFNQTLMPDWKPPSSANDVFLKASDGNTYDTNAYLLKEGNVSYIQTGHSSGLSNTAEQKVLANLIYSLAYFYFDEQGIDQALDTISPSKPEYIVNGDKISLVSEDYGNEYTYRILAAPIGYSFRDNSVELIEALDNYDIDSYGDSVKFSEPVTVNVAGGVKKYFYDINNNPSYLSSKYKTLDIGKDFVIPTVEEGLTQDTYVHFVSVDKANNKSKILSLKLWDLLKDEKIEVFYKDRDFNEIADTVIDSGKIGTKYNYEVLDIEGYKYSNNITSVIISADPTKNIVNLLYDKIITKQVYNVEHIKNGSEETIKFIQGSQNLPYIENGKFEYNVETFEQFDFLGYYTIGTEEVLDDNVYTVSDNIAEIIFNDNTPIYFHYERKTTDATYKVIRSDTKEILSSYTKDGKVGLSTSFTKEEILSQIVGNIEDINYYSNTAKLVDLENLYIPNLSVDSSKNVKTVELTPKTVKIIYSGYDYDQKQEVQLKTTEISYSNSKTISTPIENFEGWNYAASSYDVIDFSMNDLIVYVNYYKGTPPITTYSYSVNYINSIDDSILATSGSAINVSMTTPPTIEVKSFKNIPNILGTDREVSFAVSHIVVTYPNGESVTLSPKESIQEVLPIKNEEGSLLYDDYKVSIYYLPYTEVRYNETVVTPNTETTTEMTFYVLYNGEVIYYNGKEDLEHYNILSVTIDGNPVDIDEFDFSLVADAYEKNIDIIYEAKTYNLIVKILGNGISNIFTKYENIFILDSKTINPPTYEGYEFDFMEVSENIDSSYLNNNIFLPKVEGDYTITLHYNQQSKVDIIYNNLKGESISPKDTFYGYVNKDLDIHIPQKIKDNYELQYIYLDGIKLDINSTDIEPIFIPKKASHTISLVYKHTSVSKLTVLANKGGGVTGTGVYTIGEVVKVSAVASSGYKFDHWEDSEFITDKFHSDISIIIPDSDITIKAIFETENDDEDNDDIDTDDNVEEDKDDDTTSTTNNVLKPVKSIEKPNIPTNISADITSEKMQQIEEVYKLAKEQEREITRKYTQYIYGYPDGTVGADSPTTRSEVAQVIFNLYATEDLYNVSILDFIDVDKDTWYANSLAFAVENNIILGYTDGTFRPNNSITKAELVAIIVRVFGKDAPIVETPFLDIEDSWAKDDIGKLYGLGLLEGDGSEEFKPYQTATRAELITLINRVIDRPLEYEVKSIIPDLDEHHWAYEQVMNATQGNLSVMYNELGIVQKSLEDEINNIINSDNITEN